MALPTFDRAEDIPKGFEDAYEEVDGKWVPTVQRSIAALEAAIETERKARTAAEVVAKKAAKEVAEAATKQQAAASGMTEDELKKLYDSIEANLRAEYEPKIAELEQVQNENRALKLNDRVKALFKQFGARAQKVDDFWKLHGDEFDLTADGKPMVKSEPGKDVAKHVQGILKTRMEWVEGTRASGSGSGPTFRSTTPVGDGANPNGMTFEDLMKNPASAVAAANEG